MSDYGTFERMVELARGEWIASTPELDWLAFELNVEQGKAKALRRRADNISMRTKAINFGTDTEAMNYLASKGYSLNTDHVTSQMETQQTDYGIQKRIEAIESEIAEKVVQVHHYKWNMERTLQLLQERLPSIQGTLSEFKLELEAVTGAHATGHNQNVWTETKSKLHVSLRAKPLPGFRFLSFQGYDKQGRGKNQYRLQKRASDLGGLLNAIPDCSFQVNPNSFELRDGKDHSHAFWGRIITKSILIELWIA
jgi:hypothetical protein